MATRKPRKPLLRRLVAAGLALLAIVAGLAWRDTMADPVVRKADMAMPGMAAGQPSLRLLLLSDLHVSGPDMPPERLARIVAQANALKPDIVLLAGDFISDKRIATRLYGYAEALAPLKALRPRLGTVAVLGNHDYWQDPAEARGVLEDNGVTVLANTAVRLGQLTVGGLDDYITGHTDVARTMAAMRELGPPFVVLSHSPDPFPALPADMPLMLAGHTHCGQIAYPWGGAPVTMSRFGGRYLCGRIVERKRTLIVSAGLGTSELPIRLFTRPDMWLITLRPQTRTGPRPKPEPRL